MLVTFRTLLKGALRDRISLFYAILFPIGLLVGLGIAFKAPAYRQQLLGGMMITSAMFFALNGTAFEVMGQRNRGVYKLLRATPFHTSAFVLSLACARGLISLATSLIVLAVGVIGFGVPLSATSALLLLPVLALNTLLFTFLGFFVGNVISKVEQVNLFANLLILPMWFLSEMFYSLARAPQVVQFLSTLMPSTYQLNAINAAFAGDAGAAVLPLLALAAFTGGALALAVATFRWDPHAPLVRIRTVRTASAQR